ncbi:MAG: SPOR domain-containing protein [Proteiniphilum sp.]|nr:SPOR domain-containing protein [Proteiniphilum sp.]
MKFSLYLIALLLFSVVFVRAYSQVTSQKNEILNELTSSVPGKGRVAIYEDESIKNVLGRSMSPPRRVYSTNDGSVQYHKMRGYKIQAFSGNNQRTSKNEAYHKQGLISTSFPQLETVVLFESPFWRLRVGNFEEREEAEEVLKEIRRSFPSFGKEMYIVVDEVKIPINQTSRDGD